MKPNVKIGSFLLAVMMILSTIFVAGCTPISLNKEWSYKTADQELAIGVYIYSLDVAYAQAKTYAEKLDDYDSSKSDWLDMEITDDDGDKMVAREWIKAEAKTMCLSYLVLDAQVKEMGIDVEGATLDSAKAQAETYWNVGQYADMGYVMPMSADLEPFGISFDSFAYCSTIYSVKYSALFDAIYNVGGTKEVKVDELTKFFTENYTDYSYVSVNLYESTTDEAGSASNVALAEADAKKLTDEFDNYAKELNGGKSFGDVMTEYMKANKIEADPSTSKVEQLKDTSIGDELKKAVEELDSKKATTIKVGEANSSMYYLVYKRDINETAKTYFNNEANHNSILSAMKSEEFADYIEGLTKDFECEENTSVINKYDPKMFFVPVEPTTSADEEKADE